MSQQQVISYADLSIINSALRSISSDIGSINTELGEINFKQDELESELAKLAGAFADFVEQDRKSKALQLAETRVGNLKQDLHIRFGYYAEIRRMATGILQGVDNGVISDDTLRSTTEEVMLKAPGYWLAPALVSLASWIRSDKDVCEKALNGALKKDDYKTTLFFMLVMRRLGRIEASLLWLERYFAHQDPHNLDREFVVILEAVTTGVFPPASRNLMMRTVKIWLDLLSGTGNFVDNQKTQWITYFETAAPSIDTEFKLLKKFSPTYHDLEKSLRCARTYEIMIAHFSNVVKSASDLSKGVKVQLDEILSLLVTNFDDEELPFQKQVRLNELIIEFDGDKDLAESKMTAEENIFEEKVDILQLLTNAAFDAEQAGATRATQALAVSISQPWIIEAHDVFTGRNRQNVPQVIELNIDDCMLRTKDGKDEQELLDAQHRHYEQLLVTQLRELRFPFALVIFGILLVGIGAWVLDESTIFPATLLILGGIALCMVAGVNHFRNKTKVQEKVRERHTKAEEVLRGCIAEVVDYRIEYIAEDQKAEVLRTLLASIVPEDFSSLSKESSRNIVTA